MTAPPINRPARPAVAVSAAPRIVALRTGLPWLSLIWVSLVAALWVAMSEISRLSASVLDTTGRAWAVGDLMGPSALASSAGWSADFGTDHTWLWSLRAYLVLDVVFIALYLVALLRIIGRRYVNGTRRALTWLVWILVIADLTENVIAWSATAVGPLPPRWATVLAIVSLAKLALGVWAAVVGSYGVLTMNHRGLGHNLSVLYEVLRKHRLSLIPLAVLGIVLVAPGAEILDQVPDIERRWADGPANFWSEGLPGLLALGALSLALLLLGRARTHLACTRFAGRRNHQDQPDQQVQPDQQDRQDEQGRQDEQDQQDEPERRDQPIQLDPPTSRHLRLWWAGPAGLVVAAAILRLFGAEVEWLRVGAFCLLPVAIWATSVLYRRRIRRRKARLWIVRPAERFSRPQLDLLLRTGDGVALGVLVLGALGAVRSMTAIVLLGSWGIVPVNGRAWVVLLLGLLGAPGVWIVAAVVYRGLARAYSRWPNLPEGRLARWLAPCPGEQDPAMLRRYPAIALGSALLLFLGMGMVPSWFARLGVLSTFVLSILALTGIVSCASLIVNRQPLAEAFQRIHLRSTPVVALLLVAVIGAGQVGSGTTIHAVRTQPAATPVESPPARPDLADSVATWANGQVAGGCTRTVEGPSGPIEAVPMVLMAAEGGGIRAAYWTVQSAQRLADNPCAQHSTLFSSGVSGGAVGLAVLRFNQNPTNVMKDMANSRALSFGLVGLFIRDFTYAATGLPLPDLNRAEPTAWVDRSALMEYAWNEAAAAPDTWQDRNFVGPPARPAQQLQPTVGSVILNSMSVGNACRVWVSELRLRPVDDAVGGDTDGKIDCDQDHAGGLRSIDALSAYGAEGGVPGAGHSVGCLDGMSAATAAMLAARFPYVTPSGRIGRCARADGTRSPVDQLVDGGYLENTGLGTINDLADVWLPAVQEWNAAQLGQRKAVPKVIVPLIVYLNNDSGNDKNAPQRQITGEALVPPLAKLRAGSGAVSDATTLQRSADLVEPDRICPPGDSRCRLAVTSMPRRVFMVYPSSKPQIAAPLGWILSKSSLDSMDSAIDYQAQYGCDNQDLSEQVGNVVCRRGYGTLNDLLAALKPG